MADNDYVETIDADLEELIPLFMANTRKEVEAMHAAIDEGDFTTVRRLGHSTKGAAYGYGFQGMGAIGLQIESAADSANASQLKTLVQQLEEYIEQVRIIYE